MIAISETESLVLSGKHFSISKRSFYAFSFEWFVLPHCNCDYLCLHFIFVCDKNDRCIRDTDVHLSFKKCDFPGSRIVHYGWSVPFWRNLLKNVIYILNLYWSLVDLQFCIHFCCIAKWFNIHYFPYSLLWWFMIDVEQSSLHCTVGPCLSILCVIRTQSTFDPLKSYKDRSRQNLLFFSILYCSIPFHQHYLKTYYVPTPVSVYLCFYHLLNEKALRGANESGQVALTAGPVSPCHSPTLAPH